MSFIFTKMCAEKVGCSKKNFFRVAVVEDKLKSAEIILKELENLCINSYLLFLKYVLNYFNSLNDLYQSKDTLIQELYSE